MRGEGSSRKGALSTLNDLVSAERNCGKAPEWTYFFLRVRVQLERPPVVGWVEPEARPTGTPWPALERPPVVGWVEPEARPTGTPRPARWASLRSTPPYQL